MTDHDNDTGHDTVLDNTYKETNVIHYVCKLGAAPILQVGMHSSGMLVIES